MILHDLELEPLRSREAFQAIIRRIGPVKTAEPTSPIAP
jgi:hypothetical protein